MGLQCELVATTDSDPFNVARMTQQPARLAATNPTSWAAYLGGGDCRLAWPEAGLLFVIRHRQRALTNPQLPGGPHRRPGRRNAGSRLP